MEAIHAVEEQNMKERQEGQVQFMQQKNQACVQKCGSVASAKTPVFSALPPGFLLSCSL